jgi:hypothetical protein
MMPAGALETLRSADAILLGAVGHPDIPDHVTLHGLLLPIRRTFDQFANVRPAILYEGVESPLKGFPPRHFLCNKEDPASVPRIQAPYTLRYREDTLFCRWYILLRLVYGR